MSERHWTAREILALSGSFWGSAALQAGVRLDIFTALDEGPADLRELAARLSCDARALDMLVTALAAFGFLVRQDHTVRATVPALRCLSRNSSDYLGFLILHHQALMPAWAELTRCVQSGAPAQSDSVFLTGSQDERENFLMGMFNVATQQADAVAGALDLSAARRLLDLGGGPGTYALYFCKANPSLRAVVFDLPGTRPFAEQLIRRQGLEERISFTGGDFEQDPLPTGFDVAWLSQILHGCAGPGAAAALVAKAAASLVPGGRLFIQEFALRDDRSGPLHSALFGLNMLVETKGGQVYTERELKEMLAAAGAVRLEIPDLALPDGCRIVGGTMPGAD